MLHIGLKQLVGQRSPGLRIFLTLVKMKILSAIMILRKKIQYYYYRRLWITVEYFYFASDVNSMQKIDVSEYHEQNLLRPCKVYFCPSPLYIIGICRKIYRDSKHIGHILQERENLFYIL